jgi:hypothetical protein
LAFVYKYCPWLFPCSCPLTSISGPPWLRPLPIRIPSHCAFLWPPTSQQVKSQGWMSKKSHFFEIHVFFKFKDASKWIDWNINMNRLLSDWYEEFVIWE